MMANKEEQAQTILRLPKTLLDRIDEQAKITKRSRNSEILILLEIALEKVE
jgi:hypothetical protein